MSRLCVPNYLNRFCVFRADTVAALLRALPRSAEAASSPIVDAYRRHPGTTGTHWSDVYDSLGEALNATAVAAGLGDVQPVVLAAVERRLAEVVGHVEQCVARHGIIDTILP